LLLQWLRDTAEKLRHFCAEMAAVAAALWKIIAREMTVGSTSSHLLRHERGEGGGKIGDPSVISPRFSWAASAFVSPFFWRGVAVEVMLLQICKPRCRRYVCVARAQASRLKFARGFPSDASTTARRPGSISLLPYLYRPGPGHPNCDG